MSSSDYIVGEETQEKDILSTAWFINLVNKWFFLMTARSESGGGWSLKCLDAYIHAQDFLHEFIYIFTFMKVGGKEALKPIQQGAIISTTSMMEIHEQYLYVKKFSFFLPGRINQDTLENFFGVVRSKMSKPSAFDFKNILKSISVSLYMKKTGSHTGSYDEDDRFYMKGFLESIKNSPKENMETTKLPPCPAWVFTQANNSKMLRYETMALYNISGYIVNKINKNRFKSCKECISSLGSYIPSRTEYSRYQLLKAKTLRSSNSQKLFYVSEKSFQFFRKMENVFRFYSEKDLLFNGNVKDGLFKQMSKISEEFLDCHKIKNRIINNFIVFRLRINSKRRLRTGINNYSSNSMNEKCMT